MKKTLGIIAGLLVLYFGAYLSLLIRFEVRFGTYGGFAGMKRRANYRFGGEIAERIFRPLEIIDRRVRPQFWEFTEEDFDRSKW